MEEEDQVVGEEGALGEEGTLGEEAALSSEGGLGSEEDGVVAMSSEDGAPPSQEVIGLLLQQNDEQVLTIGGEMGGVHPAVTTIEGLPTVTGDPPLSEEALEDTEGSHHADSPQAPTMHTVEASHLLDEHHIGGQQLVTLPNGQQVQALSVTLADDGKMLEGQTIQLEDGTTAIVQNVMPDPKTEEAPPTTVAQLPKFAEGQAIQLEDGTIAYIQNTNKDGFQAVQLEDGTTAYIATSGTEGLFGDGTPIETTQLTLDQLNQQQAVIAAGDANGQVRLSSERAMSMSEKAYRCNYDGCGRLYTTQHHLKVHERSHTGDRPFKCKADGCGKAFATGYGLKSHTRVHTGEKPYRCPEEACDKAFKTSGDLQKHVRTHTGERPFKCPFEGCERSFTTSNIRKVHIRTHTGERPYICDEDGCNKAFASATNYKNHIRIHTGEKPYVCTVEGCGKRFTEYSSLYKHHVVHTHSKPYVCNHCGKNYRQTSTLAMHKRTAHGDESAVDGEAALLMQGNMMQGADLATLSSALPPNGANPAMKRIQVQLPPGFTSTETPMEEDEGALVINTADAPQVTMMTDNQVIGGFTQEAAQATLQQLTSGQGITLADGDGQQHIYVVTDPAQLEALQQLAQQQLFGQATEDGTAAEDVATVVTTAD